MTSNWCEENTTKSCKTSFKRKISFKSCTDPAVSTEYCLQVTSKVWWSDTEPTNDDSTESLTLSQIIAPLD